MLMTLMGVTSLDTKNLIGFPHGITPPKDAMGKELLHFDWKQNKKYMVITRVLEYIRSNGAGNHPPAAPFLPKILDLHLREKVTQ